MVGGSPRTTLGNPVLIDAAIMSLYAPSYLTSKSEKALSRTEALLKDAEMQKNRVPNIMASTQERNADFTPFALSANKAPGPAAKACVWCLQYDTIGVSHMGQSENESPSSCPRPRKRSTGRTRALPPLGLSTAQTPPRKRLFYRQATGQTY